MRDDRPPVEVLQKRVDRVRELYGLGQRLPPEVTVFRDVPEGLPISRRLNDVPNRGRLLAMRNDPCPRCGCREWAPHGVRWSRCASCHRAAARERGRRKRAQSVAR